MTRAAVVAELVRILREHVAITAPLADTTRLQAELHLDSLQQITFVVEVENFFKICFDSGDEAGLKTLGDVAAYVLTQAHGLAPNASDSLPPASR